MGRSKAGEEAAKELRWAMERRRRSVKGERGTPPVAPRAARGGPFVAGW